MKQKLEISKYLRELNKSVDQINKYRYDELEVDKLDCKRLSERLSVTASSITNATLDSKFSLIMKIAEEIYTSYFSYFHFITVQDREYYGPDEIVDTYDVYWVLYQITEIYVKKED